MLIAFLFLKNRCYYSRRETYFLSSSSSIWSIHKLFINIDDVIDREDQNKWKYKKKENYLILFDDLLRKFCKE